MACLEIGIRDFKLDGIDLFVQIILNKTKWCFEGECSNNGGNFFQRKLQVEKSY